MLGWLRRWFGSKPVAGDHADSNAAADDADDAPAADSTSDDNSDDDGDRDTFDPEAPVPLTDELDLHTFQPRECADVVDEYIRAAREAKFSSVRVIHGKGKGVLRRIVHGVLEKHPDVESFQLADQRSGSWGATLVRLKP